ncbi:MAG: galactokinase [Acidimicrobiia bacterium]|nr:galactokinase [Acidimicrobiia bacterium]
MPETRTRRAFAPGRVNLIGEHTDYTGGLVLPVALELGITVEVTTGGGRIVGVSAGHQSAELPALAGGSDLAAVEPAWIRFLVAAARRIGVVDGFTATVSSDLPVGGTGLSSSSALTCAAVLAMGAEGTVIELARLARLAEIDATGVEIGIMDQAVSMGGVADHALLIDCRTLDITPVPVPSSIEVLVVHTGQSRDLAGSAYRRRLDECRRIEQAIGPLRDAGQDAIAELDDPVLARRARHVITENERVRRMIDALAAADGPAAGKVLLEGHRSLRTDYEVSTPIVDDLVATVAGTTGVYGARLTGGGFGGSLVALCEPGTEVALDTWWTRARPGVGAHLLA